MHAAQFEALRRDLAGLVGQRHVSVRPSVRGLYGRDCWPKSLLWERAGETRYQPDVVVWPGSTDEVAKVIRYARERHLPVTPFGAGSGVAAGAVPLRAGITIDAKRLRRVSLVDVPERRAVAQAGILGQRLEEALNAKGATLGHFPTSIYSSTLGGWIATRAAGQFAGRYGKIEDMLLGLTAVTGTGEIVRAGPERAPGPDLVQLLAGSEGTLGFVTDATLRVHPMPSRRALRGFAIRGISQGLAAIRAILRAGLRPHLLRLYDPLDSQVLGEREGHAPEHLPTMVAGVVDALRHRSLGWALAVPQLVNRAVEMLPPRCLLLVSYEGDHEAPLAEELAETIDILREHGATDLGEGPARRWYRRRYASGYRQSAVFAGGAWMDTVEAAATWDRADRIYEAVRRAVSKDAFVLCRFPHAYLEGVSLSFTLAGPAPTPEKGEETLDRAVRAAHRAVLELGGTLSHHHGIGAARALQLPEELGDAGMRMLRAMKTAFDPDGIMNPGKLLA